MVAEEEVQLPPACVACVPRTRQARDAAQTLEGKW